MFGVPDFAASQGLDVTVTAKLDALIRRGAERLRPSFFAPHIRFVLSHEAPGGGFTGRRGGADIYYTDFALRCLNLTGAGRDAMQRTSCYLRSVFASPPANAAERFNRLNCALLLNRAGIELDLPLGLDHRAPAFETLDGIYDAFLSTLCAEASATALPDPQRIASLLKATACGGAWAARPGANTPQTNASAATLVTAHLLNIDNTINRDAALDFLSSMQAGDGGFKAHGQTPHGDLLSTHSVLALFALDGPNLGIRLADCARFVRSAMNSAGGFGGHAGDTPDVEYTWYGLASVSILRALADRPTGAPATNTPSLDIRS